MPLRIRPRPSTTNALRAAQVCTRCTVVASSALGSARHRPYVWPPTCRRLPAYCDRPSVRLHRRRFRREPWKPPKRECDPRCSKLELRIGNDAYCDASASDPIWACMDGSTGAPWYASRIENPGNHRSASVIHDVQSWNSESHRIQYGHVWMLAQALPGMLPELTRRQRMPLTTGVPVRFVVDFRTQ
jgi:hypothetical protein